MYILTSIPRKYPKNIISCACNLFHIMLSHFCCIFFLHACRCKNHLCVLCFLQGQLILQCWQFCVLGHNKTLLNWTCGACFISEYRDHVGFHIVLFFFITTSHFVIDVLGVVGAIFLNKHSFSEGTWFDLSILVWRD